MNTKRTPIIVEYINEDNYPRFVPVGSPLTFACEDCIKEFPDIKFEFGKKYLVKFTKTKPKKLAADSACVAAKYNGIKICFDSDDDGYYTLSNLDKALKESGFPNAYQESIKWSTMFITVTPLNPVAITKENKDKTISIIKRVATVREAEDFLGNDSSIDKDDLHQGMYGIDAPEEML